MEQVKINWGKKIRKPNTSSGWIFPVVAVGIILRLMFLLGGVASTTAAEQWPLHGSMSNILVGPTFGKYMSFKQVLKWYKFCKRKL